jgi:competence protein CoiA
MINIGAKIKILPMQWIALDESNHPIPAPRALKHKRYLCPECLRSVQLRSGPHRRPHFYHLQAHASCGQHQKTEEHLGLQMLLASRISSGQAQVERRFPEIRRIADVAWEPRKIVFEIQCSAMTRDEAENRCRDYRSLGWEVRWILSDARFNKRRLCAAEHYLREQICYFSHWGAEPLVYDQWEVIYGFRRLRKGPRIPADPLLAPARPPTPALENSREHPASPAWHALAWEWYKLRLKKLLRKL